MTLRIGVAIATLCAAGIASAKDDDAIVRAKALFTEAETQYTLSHYAEALAAYEQAFIAKPLPGLAFNIGQCHRMLGHHKEAVRAYERFLQAMPNAENREEVERLVASERQALEAVAVGKDPATVGAAPSAPPPGAPTAPVPAATAPAAPSPAPSEATAAPPASTAPASPARPSRPTEPTISPTFADEQHEPAPKPVYKKGWFWGVVVGAVVVVGGGVALGLAFGLPNDAAATPGTATSLNLSF